MAPSIVVTSNKGRTVFNFGEIAVGKSLSMGTALLLGHIFRPRY